GEAVLEEVQFAAGPEHAAQLGEGGVDVGDRAEGERAEGAVAGAIVDGERLAVEADVGDGGVAGADAPGGALASHVRRLDGEHLRDLGRVDGHVQPGAEADLDDAAV